MTDHDAIPFLYLDNMKYLKRVLAGIWLKYIKLFCLKKKQLFFYHVSKTVYIALYNPKHQSLLENKLKFRESWKGSEK